MFKKSDKPLSLPVLELENSAAGSILQQQASAPEYVQEANLRSEPASSSNAKLQTSLLPSDDKLKSTRTSSNSLPQYVQTNVRILGKESPLSSPPHTPLVSSEHEKIPHPPPPPPPLPGKIPHPPTQKPKLVSDDESLNAGKKKYKKTKFPSQQLPLAERMTDIDYVTGLMMEENSSANFFEDIEFAMNRLFVLGTSSVFATTDALIEQYVRILTDCTYEHVPSTTRSEVIEVLINKSWPESLLKIVKFQLEEFESNSATNRSYIYIINYLCNMLEMVKLLILKVSSDAALIIYDSCINQLVPLLESQFLVKIGRGIPSSELYRIVSSLVTTVCDFLLVAEIRKQRLRKDPKTSMRLANLLNQFMRCDDGDNPLHPVCHTALGHLDKDLEQYQIPPLPNHLKQIEDVDQFIDQCLWVARAMSAIPVEQHVLNPWRYHKYFSFMANAKPSGRKGSTEYTNNQRRKYEALMKDGTWSKLTIDIYSATMDRVNIHTFMMESVCVMESILVNLYNALNLAYHVGDIRDPDIQRLMFDKYFPFMLKELPSEKLGFLENLNCRSSRVEPLLMNIGSRMLNSIYNFVYYYDVCVPVIKESRMMQIVGLIRKNARCRHIKTTCLLIIAYLLDETDDHELLQITDDDLKYLIGELRTTLLKSNDSEYHAAELIDGLNRIAVGDANKIKLLNNSVLVPLVKSLNAKTYPTPQVAAAAKAVWNLAFTQECRKAIINQAGLMQALTSLEFSEDFTVRAAVSGALWQLEGKEQHVKDVEKATANTFDEYVSKDKHIMLSYNHQAKEEVNKMKERLREKGYKVWIDQEQITTGGSTLEAMSNAIEDSCLVLMFFSEAYKNSVNCRAEAEYVFERRKPFLPIQVQHKYNPDGWLGILCGTKYRYTVSKPEKYAAEVSGLLAKVDEIVTGQVPAPSSHEKAKPPDVVASGSSAFSLPLVTSGSDYRPRSGDDIITECSSWTTEQVGDWLESHDLGKFKDSLGSMDGPLLSELIYLRVYQEAAFHTVISNLSEARVPDLLKLSLEVWRLYRK